MIKRYGLILLLLACAPGIAPAQGLSDQLDSPSLVDSLAARRTAHYVAIVESTNKLLVHYASLSPRRQKRLAFVAIPSAKLRRAALKWLIPNDPESALRLMLKPAQRQGLPPFILDLLERQIHATGDLKQAITEYLPIGDPQQHAPASVTSWNANVGQESLNAFVYGVRNAQQTKYDISIHGIALDELMAVDADPLYELDDFELIQYGFQTGMFVALIGEIPFVFPDGFALAKQREALISQVLQTGPRPLAIPPWTTGQKEILVVRADFTDSAGTPYTDGEINSIVAETSTFFEENSRGQTSISATILPETLLLSTATTDYSVMGIDEAHEAVGIAAFLAAQGFDSDMGGTGLYDPGNYDRYLVLTPRIFSGNTANGQISGERVVVAGDGLDFVTLAHELGHTWGFIHSSFWRVDYDASPIGPGTHDDYGDFWDMMGEPRLGETDVMPERRHFNAYFKWRSGWFPLTDSVDATAGGSFRLWSHDFESAAAIPGPRAIRVDGADGTSYWLGARRRFGFEGNHAMYHGIEVRRLISVPGGQLLQLLDMKPTQGTTIVHSLTMGPDGFYDADNGITIRVVASGITSEGFYADVEITRD